MAAVLAILWFCIWFVVGMALFVFVCAVALLDTFVREPENTLALIKGIWAEVTSSRPRR